MLEFLFSQYKNYPTYEIALEVTAIIFGLFSVWYAKKDNIWVFPTGIISTAIYVYLLWKWRLLGDMMINFYYFVMSIYGWYCWTRKENDTVVFPIAVMIKQEKRTAFYIFVATEIFVIVVYRFFNYPITWISTIDIFVTGLFFVGMWLMAKRKIENWYLWISINVICIWLYFAKQVYFLSLEYVIFLGLASYGLYNWKRQLKHA